MNFFKQFFLAFSVALSALCIVAITLFYMIVCASFMLIAILLSCKRTLQSMQKAVFLIYIAIIGIILFFSLYVVAAVVFPGGSYANINDTSFSFINNYWCDLLAEKSKRG